MIENIEWRLISECGSLRLKISTGKLKIGKGWKQAGDNSLMLTSTSILRLRLCFKMVAADDRDCRDTEKFLDSVRQFFNGVSS